MILTTRDRPSLLRVALACYQHQTYGQRELIVVDDGEQFPVDAACLDAMGGRLVRVPAGTPLGTKLNCGVEAARGVLCQKMDDDDWYAPEFLWSMVTALMKSRQEVCFPAFAFMMPFLFFDLARWEIRKSVPKNVPGATLLFFREEWRHCRFRNVRFDEDTWFVADSLRNGLKPISVDCLESFLAVRHGSGARGERGHTWVRQWDGRKLESYLQDRPLYRTPEELLPAWVLPIYRELA